MVRRVVTMAVVVVLTTGLGRADDEASAKGSGKVSAREGTTEAADSPLPRANSAEWDVATFEDSAVVKTVKWEVKSGQVVWVLENKRDLGTDVVFGYHAVFLDEDGVKLMSVGLRWEPFPGNLSAGERNRLILELPAAEKWMNVRKVVVKGG
jgi:hypothetical protein